MNYADAERLAATLAEGLDELAAVADELRLADEAQKLRSRASQVRDDRFRVLVVGEFKRGKSTLLNAMLGDDVLPRKVAECTAVITILTYADAPGVRVHFADGTQAAMPLPEFRRQYELSVDDSDDRQVAADRFSHVEYAEIGYPVELCRHRVDLVDSPGLGAHQTRTQRTQKYLANADAVVLVLNATQFLSEEERHFLDAVLLPRGLRNIFFVVNGWNLIDDSVLRPEDADAERANLEAQIQMRLTPFCLVDGKDRSADRVFRVNALGALKGRMRKPPSAAMLEESNVPAFEASLQKFLVEDRARARADATLGAARTSAGEMTRNIDVQLKLVDRTIRDIEAEQAGIEPMLERLRGIRTHIANFLQVQSANLQDRLVVSLQHHMRRIETDLPAEIEKFDLKPITGKFLTWRAVTDVFRAEEDKLAKTIEKCVKPQVTRLLERRFAEWQQAIVQNEMRAVMIDVEKHLQEEAVEYQRVMREIEEKIGVQGSPMQIREMVGQWWRGTGAAHASRGLELPQMVSLGDFSWFIVGIVAEIIAEMILHVSTGGLTLIVSGVLTVMRVGWREASLRAQIAEAIQAGVGRGLSDMSLGQSAKLKQWVRDGFDGLQARVVGNIDDEIAIIAASLQDVLDRKQLAEYSAGEDRTRLEAARDRVRQAVRRMG